MNAPFSSCRRILVPVDFSPRAADALKYAVALGSLCRAEIDVLHVWHSDLATQVTLARDQAKRQLRDFVAGLALRGDVELRRRIEHGDPYLTIQRMAQLVGYDLVVVAGPATGRVDKDSVACRLLRCAAKSVLFVPAQCALQLRSERERVLKLSRILVPVALAGAKLAALDYACQLAAADAARVEALFSADISPAQLSCYRARPTAEGVSAFELPEVSELSAPRRAHSSRCDLLVMSGARAPAGERAADARIERVALSVPCAVLNLREC